MVNYKKGYRQSEDWKNKRFNHPNTIKSFYKKGNLPFNSGVKMSEWMPEKSNELRKKKISESLKKLYAEGKRKSFFKGKSLRKGIKHSEDTIIKNRLAHLGKKDSYQTRLRKHLSSKKGSDNHSYKNGLSKIARTHYRSFHYKFWRESVFKRDNYVCQDCEKKGVYLEAHHIIPVKECLQLDWKEEIFDVDNGLTLCKPCHDKITWGESI
jgi:5-methylcytosine-specific restriction protein A